jgi:hypothetical protein
MPFDIPELDTIRAAELRELEAWTLYERAHHIYVETKLPDSAALCFLEVDRAHMFTDLMLGGIATQFDGDEDAYSVLGDLIHLFLTLPLPRPGD